MDKKSALNPKPPWNGVKPNPYLANWLYAIAHFDSSQSDSTPYGPDRSSDSISVTWDDPTTCYAGPLNIMTLAANNPEYMWQVGTDKVSYLKKNGWEQLASYEALYEATKNEEKDDDVYNSIDESKFINFASISAKGMNIEKMKLQLETYFGINYAGRIGHGLYALVSNENVLYVKYGNDIYGFEVDNSTYQIKPKYKLPNPGKIIADDKSLNGQIVGLSMTYDGYLVVVFETGVGIINRELLKNDDTTSFKQFDPGEQITNSVAVDENNGIYVASHINTDSTNSAGYLRKLVWTGSRLLGELDDKQDDEQECENPWKTEYDTSYEQPPVIKGGCGTGATPTLMGFGTDPDKLVVITDGAERMNLLAFWRNDIPDGCSNSREAGKIPVTCGLYNSKKTTTDDPKWIQTEQSVVVSGYGAFVVNNIPDDTTKLEEDIAAMEETDSNNDFVLDMILQVSLVGPAYLGPCGIERFEWVNGGWVSKWSRSDIPSTSMVPIYSDNGKMIIVSGYNDEGAGYWQLVGLSWEGEGKTVYKMNLSNKNYGNGAYSIPQFLDDNTLIFNSIVGPTCINLDKVGKSQALTSQGNFRKKAYLHGFPS